MRPDDDYSRKRYPDLRCRGIAARGFSTFRVEDFGMDRGTLSSATMHRSAAALANYSCSIDELR